MPALISLGLACNVKYQINQYNQKNQLSQPTYFFDWLITSFEAVLQIFEVEDIQDILFLENIESIGIREIDSNYSQMTIKSLDYCESVHDVRANFEKRDIVDFIRKYKRRYDRIIELINSENKLYFVRYCHKSANITEKQKRRFKDCILKINPNCQFNLVNLIDKNSDRIKEDNYIELNLHNYLIKPIDDSDWTTSYYDWENIWKNIGL
jgi:hypothetical protein